MDEVDRAAPEGSARILFYSHDSQGLGHFRRNRALAHALATRLPSLTGAGVTGLLVNGVSGPTPAAPPRGFDVLTLPAVAKHGTGYGPRRLNLGLDAVTGLRGEIVRAALLSLRPHLVVIDRHALGLAGELTGALHALRRSLPDTAVVLGLRDVLDSPGALATEWSTTPVPVVRDLFDEIWVYGDPRVHDLRRSGELPTGLHDLVRYQGLLGHGRDHLPEPLQPPQPYLLTTAGGGGDGARLCLAASRARVPAGHRHLVVTGPQMSDPDHRAVEREAGPRTRVVRSVADAGALIRRAAASISMAGYNTACETLSTDVPALLVPRDWPRREQVIRAQALARCGAADLLDPADLSPGRLEAWWAGAVGRRTSRHGLDLTGLQSVARSALALVGARAAAGLEPGHVAV